LVTLLLNPKSILLWLAVAREAIRLAQLIGAEKALDTIKDECSNCKQPGGNNGGDTRDKRGSGRNSHTI
jgi:hypothetical protein